MSDLFFIDYDDTLLFTSYISNRMEKEKVEEVSDLIISHEEKTVFNEVDNRVCMLCNLFISKGHLYILTNAGYSWVKETSQLYLPNFYNMIYRDNKIRVVSATMLFEKYNGKDKMKTSTGADWKYFAMSYIIGQERYVMRILSIGDSTYERDAAQRIHNDKLMGNLRIGKIQHIKLKEYPSIDDILCELNCLYYNYTFLTSLSDTQVVLN
jgi:hypothetical protein